MKSMRLVAVVGDGPHARTQPTRRAVGAGFGVLFHLRVAGLDPTARGDRHLVPQ